MIAPLPLLPFYLLCACVSLLLCVCVVVLGRAPVCSGPGLSSGVSVVLLVSCVWTGGCASVRLSVCVFACAPSPPRRLTPGIGASRRGHVCWWHCRHGAVGCRHPYTYTLVSGCGWPLPLALALLGASASASALCPCPRVCCRVSCIFIFSISQRCTVRVRTMYYWPRSARGCGCSCD